MKSFTKPTKSQVDAAIPLISSPQHEAYFFARLENPLWIEPLVERGVFNFPPSAQSVEGGGIMFPPWPPSRFLVRMAAIAPAQVAQVLSTVDTDNASIIRDIVDAASAMPLDVAVALVPVVCKAAERGHLWIHFDEATSLCASLASGGQVEAAMNLAASLFTPNFDPGVEEPSRRDTYWYMEGLKKVVPVLARAEGRRFIQLLSRWLDLAVKAKKHIDVSSGEDYSYSWRPAIERHEQNHDYDFSSNLVEYVREGFEEAIRSGRLTLDQALEVIEGNRFLIFRRFRIHLINEFADANQELARKTMMTRSLFDDYEVKHEYAMLVGKRLGMLSVKQQTEWFAWVDAGPDMSGYDDSVRRNLGREPTADDRHGRIQWWKFEKYYWVREHLEGARRDFYRDMLAKNGEPELADLNVRSSHRWGHESPMSVDELSKKGFKESVECVASWEPTQSRLVGPSIEGLGDTFRQYVASDPERFSRDATLLVGKPAIYVRGFISQMAEAVKAAKDVDLSQVLDLCKWVVERPIGERNTLEQEDEGLVDRDWQWSRDEVSRLVENICKASTEGKPRYSMRGIREVLWGLIDSLSTDRSESYIVRDMSDVDPRTHDYLTLAINSPRGKAVEAALEYGRWIANQIKVVDGTKESVPGKFDAMPELRALLEHQISPPNRTYEAMAIIGAKMGLIYWIDKEWLTEHAHRIFDLAGLEKGSSRAHGWAAWNAFLVWVRPHVEFYRLFREEFNYAVSHSGRIAPEAGSQHPMHRLGEHLMILYGRGHLNLDDQGGVLRHFLDSAIPEVRRHAVGFVAQTLEGDDDIPEAVIERFEKLWDLYWAGPGRKDAQDKPESWLFGPWFASEKFPTGWSIDRLLLFVDVTGAAEPDHAVAEYLRILERLIHGDREGWRVHTWAGSARTILDVAMRAGGDAQILAKELIDHLGRRGYVEFGELLSIRKQSLT